MSYSKKLKKKPVSELGLKRNPKKTRSTILACATEAFAEWGYRGTSLSEILEKAQVNKRMIYHYYGSKEGLYRAVHVHQWKVLSEAFAKALASSEVSLVKESSLQSMMIKAMETFYDYCASHQVFLRLLMWDGLEGGKVSRSIWEESRGPVYHQIEGLIKNLQSQKVIANDLEASHLIVSYMGSVLTYFAGGSTIEDMFQKDPFSTPALQERKTQVLALFKRIFVTVHS